VVPRTAVEIILRGLRCHLRTSLSGGSAVEITLLEVDTAVPSQATMLASKIALVSAKNSLTSASTPRSPAP
jgi:hypothetical protein